MKILHFIFKVGTNPWVNIFVSILLFFLLTFIFNHYQDSFQFQSFLLGCGYIISLSIWDFGFHGLIDRYRKK